MATLKDEILNLVRKSPGLTDREITNRLRGRAAPQQPINQAARQLEGAGVLKRTQREDGLMGNFPFDGAQRNQSPVRKPTTRMDDSLSEDSLKEVLRRWLSSNGWDVRVAWRQTKGVDIQAEKGVERWLIEVKGRGSRPEMRVNYFLTILGEVLERMDDPHAKYSIALPDLEQFRSLWSRLPALAKQRTCITALFVDERGGVKEWHL